MHSDSAVSAILRGKYCRVIILNHITKGGRERNRVWLSPPF